MILQIMQMDIRGAFKNFFFSIECNFWGVLNLFLQIKTKIIIYQKITIKIYL